MESQATFSATPQTSTIADKFITNEVFEYESTQLADNDLYSTEFAIVSDSYQGQNPTKKQIAWNFIYNDLESWLDLSGSFIRLQGKINGNATAPLATQSCVYNDLRSMFEQVMFSLGGKTVSHYSRDFHIYAHVSNKFWSKSFRTTVGELNGRFADDFAGEPGLEVWQSTGFDITRLNQPPLEQLALADIAGGAVPATLVNPAVARCLNYPLNSFGETDSITNTSTGMKFGTPTVIDESGSTVVFWIPLVTMLPVLQAYPRVIKGLKVDLTLYKTVDRICLYSPGLQNSLRADDPHAEFNWDNIGCQLYVRRIRANDSIERTLTARLVEGINYKVNYQDFYNDRHLIAANNLRGEHRIANVGSLPTRVWIAFQDSRAMTDQSRPSHYSLLFDWVDTLYLYRPFPFL